MLEGIKTGALSCLWRYLKGVLAIDDGVSDGGNVQPGHLSGGTQLMMMDDLVPASRTEEHVVTRANMRGKG